MGAAQARQGRALNDRGLESPSPLQLGLGTASCTVLEVRLCVPGCRKVLSTWRSEADNFPAPLGAWTTLLNCSELLVPLCHSLQCTAGPEQLTPIGRGQIAIYSKGSQSFCVSYLRDDKSRQDRTIQFHLRFSSIFEFDPESTGQRPEFHGPVIISTKD